MKSIHKNNGERKTLFVRGEKQFCRSICYFIIISILSSRINQKLRIMIMTLFHKSSPRRWPPLYRLFWAPLPGSAAVNASRIVSLVTPLASATTVFAVFTLAGHRSVQFSLLTPFK